MHLTAKEQYAYLALMGLSRSYRQGECATMEELAETYRIPRKYLVQVLVDLRRAGVITSKRGLKGGYRLNRPPDEVTFAEVVHTMAGEPLTFDKAMSHRANGGTKVPDEGLRRCWKEVVEEIVDALRRHTLQSALDRDERYWDLTYQI